MRTQEPRLVWQFEKATSSIPRGVTARDGADCTNCSLSWTPRLPQPPVAPVAPSTHPSGPTPAAASPAFSSSKSLKRFWKLSSADTNLKPPVGAEPSPVTLRKTPQLLLLYLSTHKVPPAPAWIVKGNDMRIRDFSQLTFVARGPLTWTFILKDRITQVIIILLQREAWIYCSCLTFLLSTMESVFADKITKYWPSSQSLCYLLFDKDVRHFKLRRNFMLT